MNLATFAIAIAMMMDGTGAGLKAPTPDEQFQALRDAHQAAFDVFARAYLREHRELAVGKPAPEIEGVDLDGQKFRLADYRGKVVVLDFGSHFYCGTCRALYPHMRTLTRRLQGRRFSVISINAEPEKIVKDLKTDAPSTAGRLRLPWLGAINERTRPE
jgi:cytochrome oxidase Cu insertion factor (SCO1/SenC/PrrC family)